MKGINAGSGQRRFDTAKGWINVDVNPRWEPEIVGDWNDLSMIESGTVDYVVSHHSLEHVGCGEGAGFIKEAWRVLKPGGSLLVFVPDMKTLAQRWLLGQIDDYTFMVNTYGAYMNDEADRHKWGYSKYSLMNELSGHSLGFGLWKTIQSFDWRHVEGADIARDWWILGVECVK